jgi:hypothetical protein
MESQANKPPSAWQPLTPGGVAAFACASWGRLLLVQLVAALLAASIVVWFVQARWFSVVTTAIKALPAQSEIRSGHLQWPNKPVQTLAENRFLGLCVDLEHEGGARSPAHIQLEFGRDNFRLLSLFGCWQGVYPRGWVVAFNRTELEPWWGAWAPELLALIGAAVVAGLMATWTVLAFVYAPVAWLVGFFYDRHLNLAGSWCLAGAALVPGALFMSTGLCLYSLGVLDLIQLLAVGVLHIVFGWVYVVYGSLSAPLHPSVEGLQPNPFVSSETTRQQPVTNSPADSSEVQARGPDCDQRVV